MKVQESARRYALRVLACIFLAAILLPAFGQVAGDPQSLQTRSTSRIDKWIDYVRRTGDAKSTVSKLAATQADLKTNLDLFWQTEIFSQRVAAIELARRANRTDYQPRRREDGTVGTIKDVPLLARRPQRTGLQANRWGKRRNVRL